MAAVIAVSGADDREDPDVRAADREHGRCGNWAVGQTQGTYRSKTRTWSRVNKCMMPINLGTSAFKISETSIDYRLPPTPSAKIVQEIREVALKAAGSRTTTWT